MYSSTIIIIIAKVDYVRVIEPYPSILLTIAMNIDADDSIIVMYYRVGVCNSLNTTTSVYNSHHSQSERLVVN